MEKVIQKRQLAAIMPTGQAGSPNTRYGKSNPKTPASSHHACLP